MASIARLSLLRTPQASLLWPFFSFSLCKNDCDQTEKVKLWEFTCNGGWTAWWERNIKKGSDLLCLWRVPIAASLKRSYSVIIVYCNRYPTVEYTPSWLKSGAELPPFTSSKRSTPRTTLFRSRWYWSKRFSGDLQFYRILRRTVYK